MATGGGACVPTVKAPSREGVARYTPQHPSLDARQLEEVLQRRCVEGVRAEVQLLNRFKGYWGISSRCRTEKKSEPMELKLPRVRTWHARLRLRLKRGAQQHLIWGRWLTENRLNVYQVSQFRFGLND